MAQVDSYRRAPIPASGSLLPARPGLVWPLYWGRLLACLVLFASLLVLTACRVPGAVLPTVKIGLVAPFEGRYRYIGYDVFYAVRLAVREANRSGAIAGYGLELVAYDDGGDPVEAAMCVEKLDLDSAVLGVIGHFKGDVTEAVLDGYAKAGIPLIATAPYARPKTADDGTALWLAPSPATVADGILDQCRELGLSPIGLLASDTPLASAVRAAAHRRSVALSSDLRIGPARSAEAIAAANPAATIIDADPVTAGEATRTLRQLGWDGVIVGGHHLTPADYSAVAGSVDRVRCVTPWPMPHELAGGSQFVGRYEEVSNGQQPARLALQGYEASRLLIEAIQLSIERGGAPSRAGVAGAMRDVQLQGLLGPVAFEDEVVWEGARLTYCDPSSS